DGERVRLETISVGGGRGGAAGRGGSVAAGPAGRGAGLAAGRGGQATTPAVGPAATPPVDDNADAGRGRGPLTVRIPVKAGPRAIGVAFLERNEVRDEEVLRPRLRGLGPALAVATVTISGPLNVKGPGDTPSRRRIFV